MTVLADTNIFRLLAATAKVEHAELWHTDTKLKRLTGFPERYFVNVVEQAGPQY